MKKRARERADIVVYRDEECTDALMVIECKAPHINVALCQMLGYSPYESSLAPIICMVGAILFAQK